MHPLCLLIFLGCRITFSAMPALASCAPDDPTLQQLLSSYNKFAAWAAENTVRVQSLSARQQLSSVACIANLFCICYRVASGQSPYHQQSVVWVVSGTSSVSSELRVPGNC